MSGLLALISVPAAASTLIALDLDELTANSDSICTGTVLDGTAFLEGGRIYTLSRVEVVDPVLGVSKGQILEIVTAGGHGEHFSQKVFGAAELTTGGQYLLFLSQGTRGAKRVVGMSQGALRLATDKETGRRLVRPPVRSVRLVRRDPISRRIIEVAPWIREDRPLDGLLQEVRTVLEGAE